MKRHCSRTSGIPQKGYSALERNRFSYPTINCIPHNMASSNTDILATIVAQRLVDVKEAKAKLSFDKLKELLSQDSFKAYTSHHHTSHHTSHATRHTPHPHNTSTHHTPHTTHHTSHITHHTSHHTSHHPQPHVTRTSHPTHHPHPRTSPTHHTHTSHPHITPTHHTHTSHPHITPTSINTTFSDSRLVQETTTSGENCITG
jgi:hypothetical protein